MEKEMKRRIEDMASRTWDAIGADLLVDEDGNIDESMSIPKDEVMEVVCDADRMKMYGDDIEAYEVWDKLGSYNDKLKAISGAFLSEYYGW